MTIDLTGNFFDIIQQKIKEGQALNLDFSVVNNGDQDILEPFSFDIVISKDGVIGEGGDITIGTYEIKNGLKAGEDTGKLSYRYSTPSADNPFWLDEDHSYTVGIRIDPKNKILESNETNNSNQLQGIDSAQIEVGHFGISELETSFIECAKRPITPGGKVDLRFKVANKSEEMANPFSVDVYLSTDEKISAEEDVKLGTYDIRTIIEAGGDTGLKRFIYNTPGADDPIWSKGNGNYYVGLDLDSRKEVTEINESNNANQGLGKDISSIDVARSGEKADLVGTSVDIAQNQIAPGQKLDLGFTIANQGLANSENFAVDIYLSADENISATEDVKLGTYDIRSIIEAGENTDLKRYSYQTPGLDNAIWNQGDGKYYVGLNIDPKNKIAESNENNNSNQGLGKDLSDVNVVKPTSTEKADLVGTSVDIAQNQIAPGQKLDLG
ncbi:MAG: CARDB domain-containing protein, partial [Waterburya sp.]